MQIRRANLLPIAPSLLGALGCGEKRARTPSARAASNPRAVATPLSNDTEHDLAGPLPFVSNEDSNGVWVERVDVIGANARRVVASIPTGLRPGVAVFRRDGKRVFVSRDLSSKVEIIDAERRADPALPADESHGDERLREASCMCSIAQRARPCRRPSSRT